MKQILTKEMVKKAMDDLKADGKKTTNAILHAALGHRGSMTTVLQLKAQLQADELPVNDSDEGLKTFREVWALAKEEGRKQQESALADLKKDLEDLMQENERLEGAASAAANQAAEVKQAKAQIEAEFVSLKSRLAENQEALIQVGKDSKAVLERITAEQAAHQKTQLELAAAIKKAHELELEVVRCRTLLAPKKGRKTG